MSLLDLLLPWRCAVCLSAGAALCQPCRDAFTPVAAPLCERCGAPTAWPVARCRECAGRRLAFRAARAAVEYDAAVRRLVSAWKEQGLRTLAVAAAGIVVDLVPPPRVTALTWVPADHDRGLRRGHHPAERLARELARRWSLPAEAILVRTRASPRQRGLTGQARRRNVAGAFAARARAPTRVVLVDDVYTTGATAAAAASALRAAGARHVEVVTFARALR